MFVVDVMVLVVYVVLVEACEAVFVIMLMGVVVLQGYCTDSVGVLVVLVLVMWTDGGGNGGVGVGASQWSVRQSIRRSLCLSFLHLTSYLPPLLPCVL